VKKVKEEASKRGVDEEKLKKILAANDKLWQDKMGQALTDFKEKMRLVQEKYKKDMEN
jgi:hypothetical protein